MAISIVVTQAFQFGGSGGTSTGINTTGADLIVVALEYRKASGSNLSDSKGNVWTALTDYQEASSNSAVRMYYCSNPTVGSGHTFTTTSTFSGIGVVAVSGSRTATSPFDQQNGSTGGTSSNPQGPGSITPSVNGCLVVTGFYQATTGSAPSLPSGYNLVGTWPTATAFLGGVAYVIQTTATATNPGWGPGNVGATYATNVASFMPPAVAPTTDGKFFFLFN